MLCNAQRWEGGGGGRDSGTIHGCASTKYELAASGTILGCSSAKYELVACIEKNAGKNVLKKIGGTKKK